jgi:tyrosinase
MDRRKFLLQGAVGAGFVASGFGSVAAFAATQPPTRRSLQSLAWNDPILSAYRDAVGVLKQRPAAQKLSWEGLATIHGTDPDNFHFCPHGDWFFLPWHRAFVVMYERVIRSITGMNDFAMPFWDWTDNPLLPEVFLDKQTPDGKPNWLCVTEAGWERTWPRAKPMPPEIVGPKVLQKILTTAGYENFGTSRNPKQNTTDPSWVPMGGGTQGTLEGTSHNLVHNNIGGWMPSASSPRDPIFFMHHGNIDRIWALWNQKYLNSDDPLWTNMRFTNHFLNVDESPWSPQVSELFVPEALGYSYGLPPQAQNLPPRTLQLDRQLKALFSIPTNQLLNSSKVKTVSVENVVAATSSTPLAVEIPVPPSVLQPVRRRPPAASGTEIMDFAFLQEFSSSGVRALAFLRDVAITIPRATMFRVFVDAPSVSSATPISDPHYVGTFGVLEHKHHMGHAMTPSFVLDLTEALGGGAPADKIVLQIVPVDSSGDAPAQGTATPARIEVSFISN